MSVDVIAANSTVRAEEDPILMSGGGGGVRGGEKTSKGSAICESDLRMQSERSPQNAPRQIWPSVAFFTTNSII